MRVDYTLPAIQPSIPSDGRELVGEGGASFGQLFRGETVALPTTVEQQLGLDARPYTGTYIGPPPRPRTMDTHDANTERQRWNGLLRKHSETVGTRTRERLAPGHPVSNMLEMLREMQSMGDAIVSQAVSLTRG